MKQFLFFLSGVITLTFMSCGNGEKQATEPTEPVNGLIKLSRQQFDNSGMMLGALEIKSFPEVVKVNGMIDVPPENRAVISATMGGYIKETPWLVGDQVRKGQALVVIENPEFVRMQQEYLEIKEQLNYLEAEYERQRVLFEEKITSQKSYLRTESEYKMAVAKYNGLKKQLEMLNISPKAVEEGAIIASSVIYSPINGSITEVNVSKGTYVSPASSIMEIVDNSHIHLELSVFEKDIMKIKKGQHIQFSIPEASSGTYEAEVHLIGTSINKNRSIKVHGHLKNEAKTIFLTGMFIEAFIITDKKEFSALPSLAVVSFDETKYVLQLEKEIEDNYFFRQVPVMTSETYDAFTGILNADQFKSTDKFLVKGAFSLVLE
ncbi:MAG: efflux RND transporter periplasmic adaptor subunit [Eudoraea sp.]|nr:efflux RND transporter periplasmic adaptor subunit [Eudoraea sp.]